MDQGGLGLRLKRDGPNHGERYGTKPWKEFTSHFLVPEISFIHSCASTYNKSYHALSEVVFSYLSLLGSIEISINYSCLN